MTDPVQRRLDALRGALRDHHAGVTPDAGFATRVAAAATDEGTRGLVGWAALRLLPGTLMLVLVLSWLVWRADATPVAPAPTEDLLNWVAAQSEVRP